MANSYLTSNLGPRVSHQTTHAFRSGPGHYLIPSWMTFEVASQAAIKVSTVTTAAPTTSIVPSGFLSIVSQSGTSLVLAYNSGGTIYTFTNATAE